MTRLSKRVSAAIRRSTGRREPPVPLSDDGRMLWQMIEYAPIGIALINPSGRFNKVNPALCRMLGYPRRAIEGSFFTEFTHPDDVELSLRRFKAAWSPNSGGSEYEKRYIREDGKVIWAQVTVFSVGERGEPATFHVTQIEDITARKELEALLSEEQQLMRTFLETTPDHVYFKDLESRFTRVSSSLAAHVGYSSPDELIGKTDFDLFSDQHARQAMADEQAIIRTGGALRNLEELETFPDGRDAWVASTKVALRDDSGTIVGTFGISRDITARKRADQQLVASEERWRALLANSRELVMLLDIDGSLMYVSPSIQRWLGYAPEELIGTELARLLHDDDVAAFREVLERVHARTDERGRPIKIAHRARHKQGEWRSLESTLVYLRDDPAIRAVLVDSRDVTERVELEQERDRLELERRVSQRLEAVGQLAAGIAHEINTPMQYVGDSVTFLREAVNELLILTGLYHELLTTDEAIDRTERIKRMAHAEEDADLDYLRERIPSAFARTVDGVGRVTSIVSAMKRFSHPSSSEATPSDLNEAIETTLAVCRNEYKYAADVDLDLGALPLVTCNLGEINQVLLNLIINAAHAIEERVGGSDERGTIRISTRADGQEYVLVIEDDGCGIRPEVQDRIYEPFFTTKEVGRGSGQGLALARTTIEQHAGTIECDSTPGVGTRFTIRLPLTSPAVSGEASAASGPRPGSIASEQPRAA